MAKLSAKTVEASAAKDTEYKLSDGEGLYLRVRTTGAKSWVYCFRLSGSRKVIPYTIGPLADVSLKEARQKLRYLRKLVSEGIDPRNDRAAKRADNASAMTMNALFEAWIGFVKVGADMSPLAIKRHEDRWRLHLSKILGNILARNLGRAPIRVCKYP